MGYRAEGKSNKRSRREAERVRADGYTVRHAGGGCNVIKLDIRLLKGLRLHF